MANQIRNSYSGNWRRRAGKFWRKQARGTWREYQWILIGFLWVVTIYLGYIGFSKLYAALGQTQSPSDIFYFSLQLFVLDSGSTTGPKSWELELSRLLAPVVVAYTAVQALAAIFHESLQSLRLRFIRNHTIVCGLGRKGFLLAMELLECGDTVVVIEQDEHNAFIEQCREKGATVLIGNAANPVLLRKSGVCRAKRIVALCSDDGSNAEVAVRAKELVRDRRNRSLTCIIHIVDPRLSTLLREQEIATKADTPFRIEFFDVFDSGARVLLKNHPAYDENEVDDGCTPHVLVVGLGRFGESLVVHLSRGWWSSRSGKGKRLVISIIDRDAERKIEALRMRYPHLDKCCDLIARQMDIRWPEFERADFLFASDGSYRTTCVYVCLDNDSLGLEAGLMLRQQARQHQPIPVVVRMGHDGGLATLLRRHEVYGDTNPLHAFAVLDRACTPDLILGGSHERIARAIHEEYLRQQEGVEQTSNANPSMLPWDELPEDLKESNRLQADHLGVKLRAMGYGIEPLTDWDAERFRFEPNEIELMAEMEHQRFVEERRRLGWSYAPGPKNVARKTSPSLVPWDDLPEAEKEKDRNTVRRIPFFLARADFQIYHLKDKALEIARSVTLTLNIQ